MIFNCKQGTNRDPFHAVTTIEGVMVISQWIVTLRKKFVLVSEHVKCTADTAIRNEMESWNQVCFVMHVKQRLC